MNINLFEFQIFFLIIILQRFYKISSLTSFDYPISITLSNDNIFLIQKTGIDIYDISLNKLNQIIEFSGEDEISEEKYSNITIKYNTKYILSIINDKLFIFNNEGKLLYKSEEKINDNQIIYCYSLTFLNVTNNYFEYLLGYFDEECYLNLNLYRYNNENNNITLIYKFRTNTYGYDKNWRQYYYFNSQNKILSCEFIYNTHYFIKERIFCFYNRNPSVGILLYKIEFSYDNKIRFNQVDLKEDNIYSPGVYKVKNITSIKTEVNNNRTQAIIWWNYKDYNQTRYFIYNISGKYPDEDYYSFYVPNTCINEEKKTRINIFHTKNQFVFSCVMQNIFVQSLMYNKDNITPTNDTYMLYASCENINGLSKLYFNGNKNYLIYSCFKDCSDKNYENDTYCINKRRKTIILVILIIIAIIILFIAVFIIYKIYLKSHIKFESDWKKGEEDDKAMKDIMSDLLSNNQ